MNKPFKPINLASLKTHPIASRKSKVDQADFAHPWKPEGSLEDFLDNLPDILAVRDFKAIVSAIVKARESGKSVVLAMGAHVIKVGLNPIVADMMERGVITALAMNGAGIIHDLEVAMIGRTRSALCTRAMNRAVRIWLTAMPRQAERLAQRWSCPGRVS